MKVKLPRSFLSLPQSEKQIIEDLKNKEVEATAEINKIFGAGGYPYKYIDKLEEME